MKRRGALLKTETYEANYKRTVKSLVKTWALTHLKMPDDTWDSIQVESITAATTDTSDIIYIRCKTIEDASKITTLAKNLPKDSGPTGPKISMHIDQRARARFNEINAIAKTLRDRTDGNTQTTIRIGRHDYLLRQKERGDQTPWSKIPPVRITAELPPFEVGMYKELFNPQKYTEEVENTEEMDRIQQQLNNQGKRDRSETDNESRQTKKRQTHQLSESDSTPDTDDDEGDPPIEKYLNSTPMDIGTENPQMPKEIQRLKSIRESNVGNPPGRKNMTPNPPQIIVCETPAQKTNEKPTDKNEQIPETPDQETLKQRTNKRTNNGQ